MAKIIKEKSKKNSIYLLIIFTATKGAADRVSLAQYGKLKLYFMLLLLNQLPQK